MSLKILITVFIYTKTPPNPLPIGYPTTSNINLYSNEFVNINGGYIVNGIYAMSPGGSFLQGVYANEKGCAVFAKNNTMPINNGTLNIKIDNAIQLDDLLSYHPADYAGCRPGRP